MNKEEALNTVTDSSRDDWATSYDVPASGWETLVYKPDPDLGICLGERTAPPTGQAGPASPSASGVQVRMLQMVYDGTCLYQAYILDEYRHEGYVAAVVDAETSRGDLSAAAKTVGRLLSDDGIDYDSFVDRLTVP